jgi:(2R)-ethylmalonyl-CoA mutase
MQALREAGVHAPVVVGGIIPDQDVSALKQAGVAAVYTPKDFDINRIMRDIVKLVGSGTTVNGNGSAPHPSQTIQSSAAQA